MADSDVVKPIGTPMALDDLDRLKLVTRREFDAILSKSSYRLKAYLQAKPVGTTGRRFKR